MRASTNPAQALFRARHAASQASWDESTGPPTPPSLPPGGRRVAVKVYDKLVKELSDLTIVQARMQRVPASWSDPCCITSHRHVGMDAARDNVIRQCTRGIPMEPYAFCGQLHRFHDAEV